VRHIADEIVVVSDERRDTSVVFAGIGDEARVEAGHPNISQARSTRAKAAFGDGTCEA
jgi:hypothetical protein